MPFNDTRHARSLEPLIAAGILHAIIACGFISGLAYEVIPLSIGRA